MGMSHPVFCVGNDRTEIYQASDHFLQVLGYESSYASEVAKAAKQGYSFYQQATGNAGWDGWVYMLRRPKTGIAWFPTGLVPRMLRLVQKHNLGEVEVRDYREKPEPGFPDLGAGEISLRDYQEAAADAALEYGRGVLDMVPRSGKTRVMCEIVRRVALPAVWIVPTDRIAKQTLKTLEGFYGENFAVHAIGAKKVKAAKDARVVVMTAATAVKADVQFFQTREMIIVDEWHHGAAKTYRTIFKACTHIYYRFGMTGTFFRSGTDGREMEALLSNAIFTVKSSDLLKRDLLVPTKVVMLPVLSKRLYGVDNRFQGGHGTYGIHQHEDRNNMVTNAVSLLAKKGCTVLVLVGTIAQGEILQRKISECFSWPGVSEFDQVEFLHSKRDRGLQEKIIDTFLAKTGEVRVLIGTSLLGEGVDLPAVDAMVYAKGEQAEVTHTQYSYRVCTKVPGKNQAIIVDFADRHNSKLLNHSVARARMYYDEPIFDVDVLDDPDNFPHWLDSVFVSGQ
jgi:superfamily II DNA or RNA helicase